MKLEYQYLLLVRQWWDLRRRVIAQLICIIVYYFIRTRKRKRSYRMSSKRRKTCNSNEKVAMTKEKDTEFNELKGAIAKVAKALREGNEALREGNVILRESYNKKPPRMSGEEVWNLINECGCDVDKMPRIYCFLMSDVDKLGSIVQCPAEARKAVIMAMVFGSSNTHS